MERLLKRQLTRFGGSEDAPPRQWSSFVRAVLEAYESMELDRERLERALELMSHELTARHDDLRAELQERTRITEALRESEAHLRREIADRERMEIELRLKQKLESVGQLAAGIAHEINTPVQYVGDSAHFLHSAYQDGRSVLEKYREAMRTLPLTPEGQELLASLVQSEEDADLAYLDAQIPQAFERVFDGINRVASIVRAVKDFAHPDQRAQAPADLNRAIESTLTVSRNEYKYVAEVETDFQPLPPVDCLIGDLNQVFLNLIVNATHAIADRFSQDAGRQGRIRVATADEGDDVVVTVSDNGCGIPPQVQDRIFDPFFTTKAVGRGTGQGLSISRSIVDRHAGTLTFETEVGVGTTFYVRLPVHGRAGLQEAA